jgi:hypothetical protein
VVGPPEPPPPPQAAMVTSARMCRNRMFELLGRVG